MKSVAFVLFGGFLLSLLGLVQADIIGCGGFLKTPISIDFTQVHVKLYTSQGVLKESTDCAPNNGYYFIPLYDKGKYVLKVSPPDGWYFERQEFSLNFDGVSDPCTAGNDINFYFKGFAVKGTVNVRGSINGPEGVAVTLKPEKGDKEIMTVRTDKIGAFNLAPVMPGQYVISAAHPTYSFDVKSRDVTIDATVTEMASDFLLISGFDVTGMVVSNNEPAMGVTMILYTSGKNHGSPHNCNSSSLPDVPRGFLCHVTTDLTGKFVFSSVPSGKYILRPYYATFQVSPREVDFTVGLEPVHLSTKFLIKGFSVRGSVLASKDGRGLPNVNIYMGNDLLTATDDKGNFLLDGMEPGTYLLTPKSDDFEFGNIDVKISPSAPKMEPIIPARVRVCGRVVTVSSDSAKSVEIQSLSTPAAQPLIVNTRRSSGEFCRFLAKGRYKVSVSGPYGSQFIPTFREITVADQVITGVDFNQLRATVRGRLVRLSRNFEDQSFALSLQQRQSLTQLLSPKPSDDSYMFTNIPSGTYDVVVESSRQCFEPEKQALTVSTSEVVGPTFVQKGYILRLHSSHPITSHIKTVDGEKVSTTTLIKGNNFVCVPDTGSFVFEPFGCHGFDAESYTFEVGKEGNEIKAVSHDMSGVIDSPNNEQLYVDVSAVNTPTVKIGPLEGKKQSGDIYRYEFKYRAKENSQVVFTPRSANTVFNPESIAWASPGDCVRNDIVFTGHVGFKVVGRVVPALRDVKVTLNLTEPAREMSTLTDDQGVFRFGPLRKGDQFKLSAEKESYMMTGPDEGYTFQAHKLAQVEVQVADSSTKEKLPGVLLSLTGGEQYRSNSLTEDSGERVFHSLSPGEYFLRPVMKEYKFEPSSVIIHLNDGETKVIKLAGKRVSFSVFGTVKSLNGDPEPFVALEALGLKSCSGMVAEGVSETTGAFRIKELKPECDYRLQIKTDPSSTVYRIAPPDSIVSTKNGDVKGVELIAFQRVERVDVSIHVSATVPEHLKTLTVKLAKEDSLESPVHVVRLDSIAGGVKQWGTSAAQERFLRPGVFVQLPFIPRDGAAYIVSLESTLNRNGHTYTEPSVRFLADTPYQALRVKFHAGARIVEQESPRHLVAFISILLLVLIIWQARKGWQILGTLNSWFAARQEAPYVRQDNNPIIITEPFTKKKGKPRKV